MTDIPAIKARLSDPREVARLLGLRVEQKTNNGVLCRCPVHNNKSGSLWLRYNGGKLKMSCFGCGIYGDTIDLLVAMEGDYRAGIARAEQIAGGSSGKAYVPEPEAPRLDPEVYHELATRILEAGKLDGRQWVREVEWYLAGRRLLELARADGWAALPGLKWLLQIAEEVFDGMSAGGDSTRNDVVDREIQLAHSKGDAITNVVRPNSSGRVQENSRVLPGVDSRQASNISAHDLLISADLAQYNKRGEFVPTWGRWRLVIPWRAPDGRITSLQRRRTWEHDGNGPEPAKYVFPRGIRPEWPYGSDRLCIGQDRKEIGYGHDSDAQRRSYVASNRLANSSYGAVERTRGTDSDIRGADARSTACDSVARERVASLARVGQPVVTRIAIVEGAGDTLAMRALQPSFTALGLPGIGGWRADWAKLIPDGVDLRICLDRGKPDPHGAIPEDRTSARIALDCTGRGLETECVFEWLISRHRRGRALFCVLCGRQEAWLCRGCGRRRAPVGMDWAGLWASL